MARRVTGTAGLALALGVGVGGAGREGGRVPISRGPTRVTRG